MLPRFHWADLTTVGHYLGVLILLTGAVMCVPALVALVFGEFRQFSAFICGIGVCAALGSLLRLLKSHGLDRRRSLLLVGFAWLLIGFVASVPAFLSGELDSWFDALFDAVSALTTTGVTTAADVDSLGYAQTTWRTLLTFAGAQAVIVIAMYSGFFGEGGKIFVMKDRRDGERTRPRISETWSLVAKVTGLFAILGTFALTIVCLTLGMNPVDAFMNGFWLATCAVSTGGFTAHTSDLIYYHSLALQVVCCVLMLAGALSFGVFVYLRQGRYRQVARNSELRAYAIWIVLLVIFVIFSMTREGIFTTIGGLIQNGMVTAISAATTCGMQTVYPGQMGGDMSDGVIILLCMATIFGACAYSSGGGIKIIRILQVLRWVLYSVLLRLAPDSAHIRVNYEHFGSRVLSSKDAMLAMTVFIMYLATAALGSMAFIAHGYDALNSVFEVLSYVSNCGMTTSITYAGLPFDLKLVALLLMWAGRVEFVALIAALVGIVLSLQPSNLFSNNRSRNLRMRKDKNRGGTAWRRRKGQAPKNNAMMLAPVVALCVALAILGVSPAVAATGTSGVGQVSAEDVEGLNSADTYRDTAVNKLLSAGERQDSHAVAFTAEAIGEPIYADADHVWVNVKQDGAMIGVYMARELVEQITQYGSYGKTGDVLRIEGIYHLACEEHNGELEVHADSVSVSARGTSIEMPLSFGAFAGGLFFLLVGVLLTLLRRAKYGRTRIGFLFR